MHHDSGFLHDRHTACQAQEEATLPFTPGRARGAKASIVISRGAMHDRDRHQATTDTLGLSCRRHEGGWPVAESGDTGSSRSSPRLDPDRQHLGHAGREPLGRNLLGGWAGLLDDLRSHARRAADGQSGPGTREHTAELLFTGDTPGQYVLDGILGVVSAGSGIAATCRYSRTTRPAAPRSTTSSTRISRH